MCNVGIQPWWSHDNDDDDKDDDDDDDDGDADGNDDDDDWPTSHLRAHTFLHSAQICLGFNLKMIEAFPDGPSNSKYNSQRTAGAGQEREIWNISEEKSVCQCITRALTEGLIYPTLPGRILDEQHLPGLILLRWAASH